MPKVLVVMLLALSLLLVACGTADRAAPAAGAAISTSGVGAETPTAAPASGADAAPPTATAPTTAASETATPAGDDLTLETDTTCDGIISASSPKLTGVGELAWYASVIVVDTVQSVGEPYFIDSASRSTIATDFTITVDTPVRGVVGASLGVRQFGGTLGACTQSYAGDPAFAIGERVLLLLIAEPDGPATAARLYPAFGKQGVWSVSDAGLATSGAAHMQSAPQPLADVIQEIVTALQGTPPTGRLADLYLATLAESPIVFDETVAPEQDQGSSSAGHIQSYRPATPDGSEVAGRVSTHGVARYACA